jgi:DNA (cytosine-5)-methyltransferase 1
MPAKPSIAAVDVFCGAAGLSLGLKQAGIAVAAGIDHDPACRFAFEHNIGADFLERDVCAVSSTSVGKLFGKAKYRVLAGCAPCQPFSGYNTKHHASDERWKLLLEFLRLAKDIRPEIVTMENVPRLVHLPLWHRFVAELEAAKYHVAWGVLDASLYSVPQRRRRLVLLASQMAPIKLPEPSGDEAPSVRSAIKSLPRVAAGGQDKSDSLHSARALTPRNLKRIKLSKPAGTWRDWPSHMRADCHQSKSGRTYPSVYGRMSWDEPSPTITTQFFGFGNGRFGHPEQDRAITLREGAILQSFPKEFKFTAPDSKLSVVKIGRLIGNAVPPALGRAIGSTIVAHVRDSL